MKILVAGGFNADDVTEGQRIRPFAQALAEAIIEHHHTLLNGCRTQFDVVVAEAAYAKLREINDPDPDRRVISYVLFGYEPAHSVGKQFRSQLRNWDLAGDVLYVPETIEQADVVVLVAGFEGTHRAANWARIAGKPILPFATFGGASRTVFQRELADFDQKYSGHLDRIEFEQLNSVQPSWRDHATNIVALAEKIVESRSALIIMSYDRRPELSDAYDNFCRVMRDLEYQPDRVTEINSGERIVPEILRRLERAAFVLADLTDARPNVYFELGYAMGLHKKVIVTARKATKLPFDVHDVPTIFWESFVDLRVDLEMRIRNYVRPAWLTASPPIGPR